MAALLLIIVVYAASRALWEQTKRDMAAWRRRPARPARPGRFAAWWRRHMTAGNAGYWGHQAGHGFPTARHGLHDGWTRGREAHQRAMAGIAQNRAERAEGRAEHEPLMAEFRRRRDAALEDIKRQEIDRAHEEALVENARRGQEEPEQDIDLASALFPEQEQDEPAQDGSEQEQDEQEQPEVPAAPGDGDDMSAGTETTYQGVRDRMNQQVIDAEQHAIEAEQSVAVTEEHAEAARRTKADAGTMAEEMQALQVDAGTLGAMAEHMEALDAAESAANELNELMVRVKESWGRVQETAEAVVDVLDAGGHGALDEAHANAAGGGAEKEFYAPQ